MTSVNFFGGIRTTSRVEAYLRVEEWLRKVGSRCMHGASGQDIDGRGLHHEEEEMRE